MLPEQAHGPRSLTRGRARAGWRATEVSARPWRLGCWILAASHSGARPLRRPRFSDAAPRLRAAVAASYLPAGRCGRAGILSRAGQCGPSGPRGAVRHRRLPD